MDRILLVGGTGFIGLRVARLLARRGVGLRILDLPSALARTALPAGAEAVAGDVTDAEGLLRAAEGCSGIVHLAGIMTLDCARDPERAVRLNLLGTLNVLEAARRTGARVAWLSTAGVFGPEDARTPRPMTVYGVTKLAAEGLARVHAADHGVPSLGLRPYIVYGPGISSGVAAGPSLALAAAVRREPSTIRFSGRVGFVYVDDVARMLAAAVLSPMEGAHLLVMAGDTREMTEFTAELARRSGWDGARVEGPPLRIPADLASDPVPAWLGAQPSTSMEEGVAAALAELRQ
ncbi:NAD(P)-dependent oxidoreductase [Neomegalonema sp.]|uniref:NAD-dependent epimerase/dehydratase family protein n=1 Tax=Neomegalonema sp. TaxID=2039713 RepID=UPI00260BDD71|nr:NAD(P)-dependent oxidoreductase [Neomegalonema sp.]MDD2867877.1 NAD(P)-dependent oxidoreductase [Neomegalonema sp.]